MEISSLADIKHTSPGKLLFLPLLLIAWSDEILTPTEIELFEQRIREIDWLEEKDKKFVCSHLNPADPPSPRQMKKWLSILRESARTLPDHSRKDLTKLSLELAKMGAEESSNNYKSEYATATLTDIEEVLGIISKEALREMLAEKRRAATPIETPDEPASFDLSALQALLDGDEAEMKAKLRVFLSDPVFSLNRIPQDKESYRELVLEWCQYLADQGFGALSYPKDCGGADNMGAYITVFEMLGYHDLSLAVKFGVQFGLFGGSILGLGTDKHHKKYLPDAGSLKLPWLFCHDRSYAWFQCA